MKTIPLLLFSAVLLASGCSEKKEEPKPPVQERVTDEPQSRYGKAVHTTEELTQKIDQDRKANDDIFEEM